jgi:hypothetical protein
LSGIVSLARSSVPIQNLTLQSDGTFSGITRAGITGSTHTRAYKVTGKFWAIQLALRWKIICVPLAAVQPFDEPQSARETRSLCRNAPQGE